MSHHNFLHKLVTYGAIGAILVSSIAPPNLWADDPLEGTIPLEPGSALPDGPPILSGEISRDMDTIPLLALDDSRIMAATTVDPATDPDIDVMTRGPVHEAYAETYNYDPSPGLIVNKAPPDPIAEVPPEVRPDDTDAIWVPGYWAWDDDKMDYIWISGCWRIPPPGGRWVPGYWSKLEDGKYQWVSGFWNGAKDAELRYLPAPPASMETGPVGVSPGAGYFWAPGYWGYGGSGYGWNPGFWSPCYDNWVWCPPRYNWTPRGCLFVRGCWDWRLPCRGQLFAPCYFSRPSLFCGQRYYTPQVCLNSSIFSMHFWIRPNYCHYYFGNYYGGNALARNIQPWHSYAFRQNCGDPLFNYYQAKYAKSGVDFSQRRNDWHKHFVDNVNDRPAVNFREQVAMQRRDGDGPGHGPNLGGLGGLDGGKFSHHNMAVATTLPAVLKDQKDREVKLLKSDLKERHELANVRNQVDRLQVERKKFEHGGFTSLDGHGPKGNNGPKIFDIVPKGAPVLGDGNDGPGKNGRDGGPGRDGPGDGKFKLPKIDNPVATKGSAGSGDNKLSNTGTLRLSRPDGLESPHKDTAKFKAVEDRIKSAGGLGGPKNVLSLPGSGGSKPVLKTDNVLKPDLGGRIGGNGNGNGSGNNGNGNGPKLPRDIALPKLDNTPKVDLNPRKIETNPLKLDRGGNNSPKVDLNPRKLDSNPLKLDRGGNNGGGNNHQPKIDFKPQRIETKPLNLNGGSRGASTGPIGGGNAPKILSGSGNAPKVNLGGGHSAPRIMSNPQVSRPSMSSAPKVNLSGGSRSGGMSGGHSGGSHSGGHKK